MEEISPGFVLLRSKLIEIDVIVNLKTSILLSMVNGQWSINVIELKHFLPHKAHRKHSPDSHRDHIDVFYVTSYVPLCGKNK
jgi:hypothetical protein